MRRVSKRQWRTVQAKRRSGPPDMAPPAACTARSRVCSRSTMLMDGRWISASSMQTMFAGDPASGYAALSVWSYSPDLGACIGKTRLVERWRDRWRAGEKLPSAGPSHGACALFQRPPHRLRPRSGAARPFRKISFARQHAHRGVAEPESRDDGAAQVTTVGAMCWLAASVGAKRACGECPSRFTRDGGLPEMTEVDQRSGPSWG